MALLKQVVRKWSMFMVLADSISTMSTLFQLRLTKFHDFSLRQCDDPDARRLII